MSKILTSPASLSVSNWDNSKREYFPFSCFRIFFNLLMMGMADPYLQPLLIKWLKYKKDCIDQSFH